MASIERRGRHQFRARVRRDGYPVKQATFPTRAAAEAWAREIEALPARTDRTLFGSKTSAEWAITCGFRRLCKAVGVVGLTFHTLRHEATIRLFEKGLNIAEVGAITGHKSLQMLRRYTHLRAEDLLRKLEG